MKQARTVQDAMRIARAAAHDEGNAHMREAGRSTWAKADYNAAVAFYEWLMDSWTAGSAPCGKP